MARAVRKSPGVCQASKFLISDESHEDFNKKRKAAQIQPNSSGPQTKFARQYTPQAGTRDQKGTTLSMPLVSPQTKFSRKYTPQAGARDQKDTTLSIPLVKGQRKVQKKEFQKLTSTELLQQDISSKKKRTGLIPFQVIYAYFRA